MTQELFEKNVNIRHRVSGTHGVRFFAAVPLSLLKFSAGIPEGPGKSLKSDFPQEESLKVTILTGGVSPNLAGKAFRLDENVILGSNVAKTWGGTPLPPQRTVALWAGLADTKSRRFPQVFRKPF